MQYPWTDNLMPLGPLGAVSIPNLQLGLLIGSAVLVVLLLCLMLTRWGQSRPVLKCVVLSIVAHLLLLGWAYGTRLMFHIPTPSTLDTVAVSVVEDPVEDQAETDEERPEPWKDPVVQNVVPEIQDVMPKDDGKLSELVAPALGDGVVDEEMTTSPLPAEWDQDPTLRFDSGDPKLDMPIPALTPGSEPGQLVGESLERVDPTLPLPEFSITPPESPRVESEMADASPVPLPDMPEEAAAPTGPTTGEQIADQVKIPDLPTFPDGPAEPQTPVARDDWQPSVSAVDVMPKMEPPQEWNTPRIAALPVVHDRSGELVEKATSVPRRLGDGQPIPRFYNPRMTRDRDLIARQRGGSRETQAAVELALKWLSATQQTDGRWEPRLTGAGREKRVLGHDRRGAGAEADTGITALATLAFMGAGNTHLEGPYRENVQHALEFLVRSQTPDGCLAGDAQLFARMYCHSMALLALSEALAVTGDTRLMEPVRRGVGYTVRSQSAADGGWRYQPGDRGDMSQFGWQVMALHSASLGGVSVPESTVDGMHRFLDLCCSGRHRGLASYKPGERVSATMTAEALLCRYFMKKEIPVELRKEAEARILREPPGGARENLYYWYYATMALYHGGGEPWEQWNRQLVPALLQRQIVTGNHAGSWAPEGVWAGYGGRVYSTAMAALCLEVYYRYLPIWELKQPRSQDRMAEREDAARR